MNVGVNKKLIELIDWFNSLAHDDQINILGYLHERVDELPVSYDERKKFDELSNQIEALIIKNNNDQEKINEILIEAGLDKIFATGFYKYCLEIAAPYLDSKVIAKMSKTNIQKLCTFILNHTILYKEYEDIPFEDFMKFIGFENDKESAGRALRFIRINYLDVCNRKYSPSTLNNKLVKNFKISKEKSDVISNVLIENFSEVQQAHLLNQVNRLLTQLSSLSCTSESEA